MPVEATPVIAPASTTVSATDPSLLSLGGSEPRYYGNLVLARMRATKISAGHQVYVDWTFRDPQGNPVDLTSLAIDCAPDPCDSVSSSSSSLSSSSVSSSSAAANEIDCGVPGCNAIVLRFREILDFSSKGDYQCCGEMVDATTGKVRVWLDDKTLNPGIYWAEIAIVDPDGCPLLSNVFRIVIERSLFAMLNPARAKLQLGPPTLAEVRLHLRDSAPGESLLFDHIRFDDAEIALAIVRPIEYWNEMPPPIGVFTTSNFPFRYHWLEAICANLFWMVEEQFRANNLSYSAAGVQVNDQDKEQNYARAAERRWNNWREFVRRKKSQMNLDMCWGEVGSTYFYAQTTGAQRGKF